MKTIMVRRVSDEDHEWIKHQAESEGMMVETWLRRHFRDLRFGLAKLPAPDRWIRVSAREEAK